MLFLWPAAGTARCAVNSILHFLGEKQTEKPFSDFIVYLDSFRTMWTCTRAGLLQVQTLVQFYNLSS